MSDASTNFTDREDAELDYEIVMRRLRRNINADSEIELARALGLSSSGLANQKRRGIVPWDRVIALAVSRKISIDELIFSDRLAVCEQSGFYEVKMAEIEPDPVLTEILAWVQAWWMKADGEERIWFRIQLDRCFPERAAWVKS